MGSQDKELRILAEKLNEREWFYGITAEVITDEQGNIYVQAWPNPPHSRLTVHGMICVVSDGVVTRECLIGDWDKGDWDGLIKALLEVRTMARERGQQSRSV